MTVDTAVAPSLSLDQRHGTCSKTICMSQTCKLTVFVVHWRRFFLISTRHIECIRVVFCDDMLYKLTFTLHYGQSSDSLLTLSTLLSCTQLQCCQTRPVRKCLELFMKLLFNLFNSNHGYPLVARRFFTLMVMEHQVGHYSSISAVKIPLNLYFIVFLVCYVTKQMCHNVLLDI